MTADVKGTGQPGSAIAIGLVAGVVAFILFVASTIASDDFRIGLIVVLGATFLAAFGTYRRMGLVWILAVVVIELSIAVCCTLLLLSSIEFSS